MEWSERKVQVAGGRRERQMILRLVNVFICPFFIFKSSVFLCTSVTDLKNRRHYDGELMFLFGFVPQPSRPASLIGAN